MLTYESTHTNFFSTIIDIGYHLILPTVSLSVWYIASYCLMMRSSVIEVLTEDHILLAKAKGLSSRKILLGHVVKNALLPTMSLIGLDLGMIVAGAISIEIVFAWPGIGRLMQVSVLYRDYPVLQGTFLLLGISVVLTNFIVDILNGFLDPRIKY